MDIIRYTDNFFAMERELDLFSQRIDGTLWWDPARHDVFYFIYYRLSGAKVAQPQSSLLRRALRLVVRRWMAGKLRLKLMFGRYDVLALRAARHATNGKKADVILDDILACTPGRKLVIDTFPHYHHIKLPAKFDRPLESAELCKLNEAVRTRFGLELDIESLVTLRLTQHREALKQYGRLLDRAAPKLVILIQNGIEKALFRAAHDRSIPVVEAQHGLINYVHPAYSYPPEITAGTLTTLPDIFLAFSQHWIDQCHYPIAQSVVTGNRQLFVNRIRTESENILVVSANIYETAIEEMLRPAAGALTQRRFIYKLHPNQFAHRREITERFSDLPNVVVIANEQTLQQLMQQCSICLCIQSTCVYEALQAGLTLYLLAKLDFETHADIFDHPNVRVIHDYVEFVRGVSEPVSNNGSLPLPVFFQEFDAVATKKFMASLSA